MEKDVCTEILKTGLVFMFHQNKKKRESEEGFNVFLTSVGVSCIFKSEQGNQKRSLQELLE